MQAVPSQLLLEELTRRGKLDSGWYSSASSKVCSSATGRQFVLSAQLQYAPLSDSNNRFGSGRRLSGLPDGAEVRVKEGSMENGEDKKIGTVRYLLDDGQVVTAPVFVHPSKEHSYYVWRTDGMSIGPTPIGAASGIQKIEDKFVIGILEEFAGGAQSDFAAKVYQIANMLVAKNASYGNSALDPVRIFSRASAIEQLRVRIDDKLSRIARGTEVPNEDTVDDLLGYLVLYKIALKQCNG